MPKIISFLLLLTLVGISTVASAKERVVVIPLQENMPVTDVFLSTEAEVSIPECCDNPIAKSITIPTSVGTIKSLSISIFIRHTFIRPS